jgi:hypothetical protein
MSKGADDSEYETTTEINFRLDQNGRTVGEEDLPELEYSTKAVSGLFELEHNGDLGVAIDSTNENSVVDDLLLDCEIADCSIMPRTFWIDHSFKPRCNLEQMAHDILAHHCLIQRLSTTTVCGAEWWVQIRPFPEKISRYSVTKNETNDVSCDSCNSLTEIDGLDNGISFHWDKDEDLRILCNGTVYVHPHLSTVTYLTDNNGDSAPTFIAEDYRINNVTGEWIAPSLPQDSTETNITTNDSILTAPLSAFISWPKMGKHLCFDGRFLHAAPSDLAVKVVSIDSSKEVILCNNDNSSTIKERRRRCRYTFLVNIWLHHKPFNVHPFPDSIIDKMSGYAPVFPTTSSKRSPKIQLILNQTKDNETNALIDAKNPQQNGSQVTTVVVKSDGSVHILEHYIPERTRLADCKLDKAAEGESNLYSMFETKDRLRQFIWPLGDRGSGESIQAAIPIETAHSKALSGGNVRILWHPSSQASPGMFLVNEPDNAQKDCEPDSKRTRVE